MIEGALVFTVFMLLLMGTMEFGRFVYAYNFVAHAAREGARYAAVHASAFAPGANVTNPQLSNVANAWAAGLDNTKVTTTYSCPDSCIAGKTVQVRVKYTYVPMVGNFILPGGSVSLVSTSSSVIFQ